MTMKTKKYTRISALILLVLGGGQSMLTMANEPAPKSEYPMKISAYVGMVHPVANLQSGKVKANFSDSYNVGLPIGINFQKSPKVGLSFEVAPNITATDSIAKVQSFLLHPGVFFPLDKGWRVTKRIAYDSNGRFGFTPSVSKVLLQGNQTLSLTMPFPFRFGNGQAASMGTSVLLTYSM